MKTLIRLSLCLGFFSSTVLSANANDIEVAVAAFESENYAQAIELFMPLAEAGNDDAQFYLGAMYQSGLGIEASDETAFYWFERSAENGDDEAQYSLGLMYANGEGVKSSSKKARKWFERSAEQGHDGAQYELGEMYRRKSPKKAMPWLLKAAAQDHGDAFVSLGHMYDFGQGVAADDAKAFEYYEKAASLGSDYGKYWAAYAYIHGDGVRQDRLKGGDLLNELADRLTEEDGTLYQFVRDELGGLNRNTFYKMALKDRELDRVVAQQQVERDQAKTALSKAYTAQKNNDFVLAAHHFEQAANLDNAEAARHLGYAYERGVGVEKSHINAMHWYHKANDGNDTEAMFLLGRLYLQSTSDTVTYEAASLYLQKAADRRHENAILQMAEFETGRDLLIGEDVVGLKISPKLRDNRVRLDEEARVKVADYASEMGPENGFAFLQQGNYKAALPILEYNAERNDGESLNMLGRMYEMGWGVSRDDSQAASYYQQAIRVGSIKAKFNLGMFRMNNANNLIRQSGYDLIVEAANTGFGPAQSFVESAEAASREKARQDWKRYREETSSYGQQCRNPRKVLVSRNGGLYREETVCD